MSQGTLDRPTFEAIEAYVLDRMSPAERGAFEQRIAADPALRAEVELERENIHAVELGGLQRMLHGLRAEEQRAGKGGSGAWWRYAAAVVILLIGSVLWFGRPSANERLFTEHFTPDPGLPVAMGATDAPVFADAMVSYKEGKYAQARVKWEVLLTAEPDNDTLRYFIACTDLATDRPGHAIPELERLAREDGSPFSAKARWYLFLAYVRTGDHERARAVPIDADPVFGERARALKAQLP